MRRGNLGSNKAKSGMMLILPQLFSILATPSWNHGSPVHYLSKLRFVMLVSIT